MNRKILCDEILAMISQKLKWFLTTLNVSLPNTIASYLKGSLSFIWWSNRSMKYLGMLIPSNPSELCSLNFPPLLKSIQNDLNPGNCRNCHGLEEWPWLKSTFYPVFFMPFKQFPLSYQDPFIPHSTHTYINIFGAIANPRSDYQLFYP